MPLGNLTSQFFANVYLNELDQFVKHKLRARYYIRYVDDFVILHENKEQLKVWKEQINNFLKERLKLELHPSKSHVLKLSSGINFLGFRIFFHHKLLRKSNMNHFNRKFNQMKNLFREDFLDRDKVIESLEGWFAYAKNGDTYKYRKGIVKQFNKSFPFKKYEPIKNPERYFNFLKKVKESNLEFSVQKTLLFYREGLNIREISIKRQIKESTVWMHLANLIEHRQISIREILSEEKISKIIKKIYSKNDKLKDIKNRLKKELITFDEIACVIASIKSKR